jgi:hypothetical protein
MYQDDNNLYGRENDDDDEDLDQDQPAKGPPPANGAGGGDDLINYKGIYYNDDAG